jgi:hypothetical protein
MIGIFLFFVLVIVIIVRKGILGFLFMVDFIEDKIKHFWDVLELVLFVEDFVDVIWFIDEVH